MGDPFETKVRCAGVAGWWTLLVAIAVLLIQWLAYLLVMSSRPSWVIWLWGPDATWGFVQKVWWLATALLKVLLLFLAIPCLWLTLWARQLRKAGQA